MKKILLGGIGITSLSAAIASFLGDECSCEDKTNAYKKRRDKKRLLADYAKRQSKLDAIKDKL